MESLNINERQTLLLLLAYRLGLLNKSSGDSIVEKTSRQLKDDRRTNSPRPSGFELLASSISGDQRAAIEDVIDVWQVSGMELKKVIQQLAKGLEGQSQTDRTASVLKLTVENLFDNTLHHEPADPPTRASDSAVDSENEYDSGGFSLADIVRETSLAATIAPNSDQSSFSSQTANRMDSLLSDSQRYHVQSDLAEGGLGKVSIAHDRQFLRNVAYKQIKSNHANNADSQSRFVFEAAITGQLEHPGIVPVYSLGTDNDDRPYYAMRLIEGESFGAMIKRFFAAESSGSQRADAIEFRQLLGRFVDVCNAIGFAHSRGIIHRDLKPDNIMVGAYGETFVVDWGLARKVGGDREGQTAAAEESDEFVPGQTSQGTIVGTIAYMSPEQARGDIAGLGPASDIYSLGVILYRLLTGKSAFPQPGQLEKLEAVEFGVFDPPLAINPQTPPALNAICLKAMSRDPQARYLTTKHLANDVERWLADEPVKAWQEPLMVRSSRWIRRHRSLVTSGVALMLASIVGLIVVLTIQNQANRRLAAANKAETEAKQFAQEQFDVATSAIGQFYTGVANDFLLSQKEFSELRSSLLRSPREFYERLNESLANYPEPTPKQDETLMMSHVKLADLAQKTGEHTMALEEFDRALSLCEKLLKAIPEERFRIDKATILLAKGVSQESIGNYDDAEADFLQAVELFEALNETTNQVPEIQSELARGYAQLATLYSMTDRKEHAASELDKSMGIRQLLFDLEDSDLNRQRLGTEWSSVLNLRSDLKQHDEAIEAGEKAIDLLAPLQLADENDLQLTHEVSGTLFNLAWEYQLVGQFEKALDLCKQATASYEQLVSAAPNILEFRSAQASTFNNLGLLYEKVDELEKAKDAYEETLALKLELAEDYPNLVEAQISLAGGYVNYGGFLHGKGEYDDAIPWYDKGLKTLDRILEKQPDAGRATWFKRNPHSNRARAHRRLEQYAEAAEDFEQVLELDPDEEDRNTISNELAQMYSFQGDHARSSELAIQRSEFAESDRDFFNLAFVQSLALETALKDDSLTEDQLQVVVNLYVERAIELLRKMYATDVLDMASFLGLLKTNEYLSALQDQDAYQDFIEEIENE